jgi:hypothetical protein
MLRGKYHGHDAREQLDERRNQGIGNARPWSGAWGRMALHPLPSEVKDVDPRAGGYVK